MSSGIICKTKLDPFYQQFLRGYYNNLELVFKFPKENADELEIARKFNRLLTPPPPDYKAVPDDCNTFLIEVPFMKDKDPFYYNHLSKARNEVFAHSVHQAWRDHFHEEIVQSRNDGFEYKQCIEMYMDEFRISPQYYDRLVKDYQRWRNLKKVRNFQKKRQGLNLRFSPIT